MNTPVAVTGIGIVSPLGNSVDEFRRRMFAGESGLVDIRGSVTAQNFPVTAGGLVPKTTLAQPVVLSHLSPEDTSSSWRFAGAVTEEAIQNLPSGIPVDAIVFGTDDGVQFELARESFRVFVPDQFNWDGTRSEAVLEIMQKILERHGNGSVPDQNIVAINNACATGNQALGIALHRIRSGRWKRVLAGGVYARVNESTLLNFHMLGALTTAPVPAAEASCPFSRGRSGFVRSEGAAALLLEAEQEALARNAEIYGYLTGYAATSDAYRLTDERPDARAAVKAMEKALEDAGLTKEDVNAISAHGTSTPMNDRVETRAIKLMFGPLAYKIPVISLKSQVGHSAIVAAVWEAVASLLMLEAQRLAPTINYKEFDPDCDLDYVPNQSRPAHLEAILSNSFGFGGQNACLVLERTRR